MWRIILLVLLSIVTHLTLAQKSITLDQPIAYVVYTPVELEQIPGEFQPQHPELILTDGDQDIMIGTGHAPTWSPDGKKLAYLVSGSSPHIGLLEDGEPPRILLELQWETSGNLAWSPDNEWVVVYGLPKEKDADEVGYYAVSIIDSSTHYLGDRSDGAVGEGPILPEIASFYQERSGAALATTPVVSQVTSGVLFMIDRFVGDIGLFSVTDGEPSITTYSFSPHIQFVPHTNFIETYPTFDEAPDTTTYTYTDITTETSTYTLEFTEDIRPETFIDDTHLLYTQETWSNALLPQTFEDVQIPISVWWDLGLENFPYNTIEEFELTLYKRDLANNEPDNLILSTVGYDFGRIQPMGDDQMVVSVVTSSFALIQTIIEHDFTYPVQPEDLTPLREKIDPLRSTVIIYMLKDDEILYTRNGTQVDANPQSFTVVLDE